MSRFQIWLANLIKSLANRRRLILVSAFLLFVDASDASYKFCFVCRTTHILLKAMAVVQCSLSQKVFLLSHYSRNLSQSFCHYWLLPIPTFFNEEEELHGRPVYLELREERGAGVEGLPPVWSGWTILSFGCLWLVQIVVHETVSFQK